MAEIGGATAFKVKDEFKSTRGSVAGVSFEEAVLSGRPKDGGMFMPESFPTISKEQLRAWSTLSYPQLVEKLLRMFVGQEEMSDQDTRGTYSGGASNLTYIPLHTSMLFGGIQ